MSRSVEATSVSDFIALIESHCPDDRPVFFRGQRTDRPLLPGIARLRDLRVPAEVAEASMLRMFQRQSLPYLEIRPNNDWDWLALAQHHGMPTRLLDWSSDAVASLWFAVADPPGPHTDGSGVVWVLRPDDGDFRESPGRTSPFRLDRTVVYRPENVSKRINAQGAAFTVHASEGEPPKFRALQSDPDFRSKLLKVRIPYDHFGAIRAQLSRLGTNSFTIFPGLDGLCRHIRWLHARLEDEPEATLAADDPACNGHPKARRSRH